MSPLEESPRGEPTAPPPPPVAHPEGLPGPALAAKLAAAQAEARSLEATATAKIRKDGKLVGSYQYVPWAAWIKEGRRLLAAQGLFVGVVEHGARFDGGRTRVCATVAVVCPQPYEAMRIAIETAAGAGQREATKAEAVGRTACLAEALRSLLMLDGGGDDEVTPEEADPRLRERLSQIRTLAERLPKERRTAALKWLSDQRIQDCVAADQAYNRIHADVRFHELVRQLLEHPSNNTLTSAWQRAGFQEIGDPAELKLPQLEDIAGHLAHLQREESRRRTT